MGKVRSSISRKFVNAMDAARVEPRVPALRVFIVRKVS